MKFTSLILLVSIFTLVSFKGLVSIFDVNFKDKCCNQYSIKSTCQNNHQEPCSSNSNGICISNLTCHLNGFVLTKFYALDSPSVIIKQKTFPSVILKSLSDYSNVKWRPPRV